MVRSERDSGVYKTFDVAALCFGLPIASWGRQSSEHQGHLNHFSTFRPPGKWQLVYSSCEAFRSSPFFWAFSQGLVQNNDLSNAIFKFTDSLPIAEVKSVTQVVSLREESIVSRVVLEVWPGISGE